jgi:endonuclease I
MARLLVWMVFVLGSINCWAGTIVVSAATLPTFGNCPIYYAADPQRFVVSGTLLTASLIVTAPEHFEISTTYLGGYSSNLTLVPISGSIANTTIFVKFSPYSTGSKSGNVSNVSIGSATQNVGVLGTSISTTATGTNAATYYSTISTSSLGSGLKTALYNKILGHTVTAYGSGSSGLWATYSTTDPLFNGKVWDIYSTKLNGPSPYEYTFSTNQCGSYSVEGDCYNREHSFPQSWFSSAAPMVSDMYHIYPTDGKVNGMRSNFPFGEVSAPTFTGLQGGKLGANTTAGYTGIVFEPIDDYKGDLARSYFYMATRYDNVIANWQTNGNADEVLAGNAFPAYDAWFLNLLVKWHNQDPPSVKEINRNNAVFGYQVNRNPFIDSPQYVNRVWGGTGALEPTTVSSNFFVKSNTTTTALISWKSGNGQKRLVIARAGAAVNALPVDSIAYTANSIFGLGSQIGTGNFVVYNGMGSSIDISGLNQNVVYYFTVIEYNGLGKAINYLTSSVLNSGVIALPVSYLSFEGSLVNEQQIELQWRTASEVNNAYFEVERRFEGSDFESIARIKSKGNSNKLITYFFSDANFYNKLVGNGVVVYRLKQTDFDGNFSYSKIVQLAVAETNQISVVNPIGSNLILIADKPGEEATITMRNLEGTIVFETKITLLPETIIHLENELLPGMYILLVVQGSSQHTLKIIKP